MICLIIIKLIYNCKKDCIQFCSISIKYQITIGCFARHNNWNNFQTCLRKLSPTSLLLPNSFSRFFTEPHLSLKRALRFCKHGVENQRVDKNTDGGTSILTPDFVFHKVFLDNHTSQSQDRKESPHSSPNSSAMLLKIEKSNKLK